jgi:phage tail sheath gpL-like
MASLPNNAVASIFTAFTIEAIFGVLKAFLQADKLLAGGYDPLKTEIVPGQAYPILTAKQAGETFGFGFQLHRMAIYHFKGAGGQIPLTCLALDAASGGAKETKTITFAVDATSSGSYIFRVGSYLLDDVIQIGVSSGDTPDAIAQLLNDAINANANLPFTATVALGVVTIVAKTADITTSKLSVTVNQKESDLLPADMTVDIASTLAGAGSSDLADLWNYVIAETTPWHTSVIQPYEAELALDSGSVTVGNPNDQTGQYDPRDYRPLSIFTCDTAGGNAGLVAALALADGRENDCANVRLEAPDYPELGYEIAAYVSGVMEVSSMFESARAYTHLGLSELYGPLDPKEDWAMYKEGGKAYDNRDLAVKAGITPIMFADNLAKIGDMTSYWQPQSNQNAPFKFQVNRWKAWNIQNLYAIYINGDDNKGRAIVNSIAATKQSANAIDASVLNAGLALVTSQLEKEAWIFVALFTLNNTTVTPSDSNADRFDFVIPVILSGNNRINVGGIQIDTDQTAVNIIIAG